MGTVFRCAIATVRAIRNPSADVGVALKTTVKGHHPAITEPKRFASAASAALDKGDIRVADPYHLNIQVGLNMGNPLLALLQQKVFGNAY